MSEREELEKAMAALDGQRTVLGDAAVEAALAGLQQKLATLDKSDTASPALAGERRVVTILFCDVKGSTAMAEKLDPEEWAGIMKRVMGYLIPPVTRHDGTVARLMGDAILAFFGAPTTHEDDPQRAVRAGLDIIQGIAELREQLKRERGLDFNVRVGINTGLVFVGAIGADRRMEYTAMGDAINLAARMEQTAQPAVAQKWWERSLAQAERMGLKYDIGMIHLEMGQRHGERAHLEKAEAIFSEIGAELDLSNARKLLEGKR